MVAGKMVASASARHLGDPAPAPVDGAAAAGRFEIAGDCEASVEGFLGSSNVLCSFSVCDEMSLVLELIGLYFAVRHHDHEKIWD